MKASQVLEGLKDFEGVRISTSMFTENTDSQNVLIIATPKEELIQLQENSLHPNSFTMPLKRINETGIDSVEWDIFISENLKDAIASVIPAEGVRCAGQYCAFTYEGRAYYITADATKDLNTLVVPYKREGSCYGVAFTPCRFKELADKVIDMSIEVPRDAAVIPALYEFYSPNDPRSNGYDEARLHQEDILISLANKVVLRMSELDEKGTSAVVNFDKGMHYQVWFLKYDQPIQGVHLAEFRKIKKYLLLSFVDIAKEKDFPRLFRRNLVEGEASID